MTPNKFHRSLENHYTKYVSYIAQCTYTYGRLTPHPKSIKHRCLEYSYTKLGRSSRYSTMHIYAWQMEPPSQLSTDALNTTTTNLADLTDVAQCTYMHGKWTPSQWSIHALNTTTANLADLADMAQCTYMHGRSNPQSIKHRCL